MTTKIKDAAVVTSKYTFNGQDKSHWRNIGAVYKKDDGSMFLMLDAFFNFAALPRKEGSDRISIALFNPKSNSDNQTDNDSGVPF